MTLEASFGVRVGELELALELSVPAGGVAAVLGPNGAGKSTALRAIAGRVAIDRGRIGLGGLPLDEPPAVFVPHERRRVGFVEQDHLLFPHLSVLDNVAFAPRCRGVRPRAARALAAAQLERVGVAELAARRPRELSGGEAQRVALARALASEPALLLLDEPFASLDAATRPEIRRDLARFLAGFAGPTVLVTHDPVDALGLADSVTVLEHGRVAQSGTIVEVTAQPRSRYVADLIGTNLVRGRAVGATIEADTGVVIATAEPHAGDVFATIAPAAVALHRTEPTGSPRNRWHGSVAAFDLLGDRVRVRLAPPLGLVAEVTPGAVADLALREGDEVWASVKATEVVAYPR